MNASVVAERDEFAVVAIADAGKVAQVQRHLFDREARHKHLHDGRVLERLKRVTAAARGEGVQRRSAGEQGFLDLLPFCVVQRTFVNQHRRDVAMEGALGVRRLAGIVGVDAPADDDFIEADCRCFPFAITELDAIEEQLVALRADLRAHGEDVEILERQIGREVLSRLDEVLEARAACRLDIEHADLFRGRRSLIEIDAAGVIVLCCGGAGEHAREQTFVRSRRGKDEDGDFLRATFQAGEAEVIILAIEAHERLRTVRAKDRSSCG